MQIDILNALSNKGQMIKSFLFSLCAVSALLSQTNYNVSLFGHLSSYEGTGKTFSSGSVSDYSEIWGWTSPAGKEYAIIGSTLGSSVIDISSNTLKEVSFLPGPYSFYKY